MKQLVVFMLVMFSLRLFSANTWTDPGTQLTWTYTINPDKISVTLTEVCDATPDDFDLTLPDNGRLSVPSNVIHNGTRLPVTILGSRLFSMTDSLKEVIVPTGVVEIASEAFEVCINLTSVTFPETLTEIGRDAFVECTSLTNPQFPASLTFLGDGAFSRCTSIISVSIPSKVSTVGSGAFEDCFALGSVTFASGIAEIGEAAFGQCESLEEVCLPDGFKTLGIGAFMFCNSLSTVSLPASIESIGVDAFFGCDALKTVYTRGGAPNLPVDWGKSAGIENPSIIVTPQPEGNGPILPDGIVLSETLSKRLDAVLPAVGKITVFGSEDAIVTCLSLGIAPNLTDSSAVFALPTLQTVSFVPGMLTVRIIPAQGSFIAELPIDGAVSVFGGSTPESVTEPVTEASVDFAAYSSGKTSGTIRIKLLNRPPEAFYRVRAAAPLVTP